MALSSFLVNYGFSNSKADTSLFVYVKDKLILYMLVYVDDIILTGNNKEFIKLFISDLSERFAFKILACFKIF